MSGIRRSIRKLAGAAFLGLAALPALAQQQPQNLTIAFDVSIPSAPLSDWLTAGIALLLAATAVVAMRRQRGRPDRFFSAVVALAAGATVLSVTGSRLAQDANAFVAAQINLVTSPASLNVAPFLFISPLTVTVNNMTGKFAKITGITLDGGTYQMSTPTSCAVGLTLAPSSTCIITLVAPST